MAPPAPPPPPVPLPPFYNRYTSRCDRHGPMREDSNLTTARWYSFAREAGTHMPITAPPFQSCGTTNPGWLATSHATLGSPPRYGRVCFRTGPGPTETCTKSVEVRTCSCSYDNGVTTTHLYQLPRPPDCDSAYCAAYPALPPPPPPDHPPPGPPSVGRLLSVQGDTKEAAKTPATREPLFCAINDDDCMCIGTIFYGRLYREGGCSGTQIPTWSEFKKYQYTEMPVSGTSVCSHSHRPLSAKGNPQVDSCKQCYCLSNSG